MFLVHTLKIPESIKLFAMGISRSRSGFASERWHGLLPFSWHFYLVCGVFSDVRDLKNILMWMVILQLKVHL